MKHKKARRFERGEKSTRGSETKTPGLRAHFPLLEIGSWGEVLASHTTARGSVTFGSFVFRRSEPPRPSDHPNLFAGLRLCTLFIYLLIFLFFYFFIFLFFIFYFFIFYFSIFSFFYFFIFLFIYLFIYLFFLFVFAGRGSSRDALPWG